MKKIVCIIGALLMASLSSCSDHSVSIAPPESEKTIETTINANPQWGPERETFTMDTPTEYALFNSILNSPEIGDERNFVRIREIGKNFFYSDRVKVTPGKEYEVFIYYNNNAGEDTNPTGFGVADSTSISSSPYPMKLNSGEIGTITANLSWSFVTPEEPNNPQIGQIWDTAYLETDYDNVVLRFKAASAIIHNDGEANGSILPSALFTPKGTPIGYNKLAGTIPGGTKYSGYITYTIVAEIPRDTGDRGPVRETFTNAEPAGYAIFNSITDNAAVGDERAFVRIRELNDDSKFTASVGEAFLVEPGKSYEVYIYYHNNAASNTNETGEGVATGVRCRARFSSEIQGGEFGYVNAKIMANDTNPQEVWSEVALFANEDVSIEYIANSAVIHNGWQTNGMILVQDQLFGDGAFLGVDSLNGVVFGCAEFSGHVTYEVKVTALED